MSAAAEAEQQLALPRIGFGTSASRDVQAQVGASLAAGFRLVDTAKQYGNEPEIGAALQAAFAAGSVSREEVFLLTKISEKDLGYDATAAGVQEALTKLTVPCIDAVLIHWPGDRADMSNPANSERRLGSWRALEELRAQGKVRNIGVSNFTIAHCQEIMAVSSTPIYANEIEVHPWLQNSELVDFCQEHNIKVVAYSPFGRPPRSDVMSDPVLQSIAAKLGATPGELILRWMVQRGLYPIPKAESREHIQANFAAASKAMDPAQRLDSDTMLQIGELDRGHRIFADPGAQPVPAEPEMMAAKARVKLLEAHLGAKAPAAPSPAAAAAASRPFGVEDMFRERALGSAQLSPCGTRVAYTVTTTDRITDSSETALWMASTVEADAQPLRLTAKGTDASDPQWSPDGSMLAFLSSRVEPGSTDSPSTQVWALRLVGGEAFKLTSLDSGVNTFEWSPDIERPRLLLSTRETLAPSEGKDGDHPANENDGGKEPVKAEPWVMDSLQFKQDYIGYLDQTRGGTHLWVQEPAVPPEDDDSEGESSAPTLTQITSGMKTDETSAAWSPDGRRVAFASNRTADPDTNSSSNIYVVSADNTDRGRSLVRVTAAEGSGDSQPAWSADGKTIAYVTTPNADADLIAGSGFGTPHLAIAPADGSGAATPTILTQTLDRNVGSPFFGGGDFSDTIFFKVSDSGRVELASIRIDGSDLTRILQGEYDVGEVHMLGGGGSSRGATVISYPNAPGELYLFGAVNIGVPRGGSGAATDDSSREWQLRKLTSVNDAWLSSLQLGTVRKVGFPCKDSRDYTHIGHRAIRLDTVNDTVEMFVHFPPGFEDMTSAVDGLKYPTILWIHGGPVSQYTYGWSAEQHMFAAAGYVVLSVNPRGSTGRGQAFCEALFADWGGPALRDVLAAVDFAVEQGWSDPARLCVGGWSYGGMLTDHVIVSDHRFKAAITGASAVLYRASYGHDQYQLLWEQELGLPWEHPETWEAISPFNQDWNVPVQNSDQLYIALKRLGVETSLVVYPDQHHWVGLPSMEADIYQRWLGWFDGHTS